MIHTPLVVGGWRQIVGSRWRWEGSANGAVDGPRGLDDQRQVLCGDRSPDRHVTSCHVTAVGPANSLI